MSSNRPQINQPVHYVARGSADGVFPPVCRAALVTDRGTEETDVSIVVFNSTGLFFQVDCRHDEAQGPGTWHYPCVPPVLPPLEVPTSVPVSPVDER